MSISFKNQSVVRLRATVTEQRGDKVRDWSTAAELTITGCRLQPRVRDEIHFSGSNDLGGAARHGVVRSFVLFAPFDADITELDRVRYNGRVYEVEGNVRPWISVSGDLAHIEVVLADVAG